MFDAWNNKWNVPGPLDLHIKIIIFYIIFEVGEIGVYFSHVFLVSKWTYFFPVLLHLFDVCWSSRRNKRKKLEVRAFSILPTVGLNACRSKWIYGKKIWDISVGNSFAQFRVISRIYTEHLLVITTTITSVCLLSSQCKYGEIVWLLCSLAGLSNRRYSIQNVSSDGHLRYLRISQKNK